MSGHAVFDRVRKPFASTPDLDITIFVSNMKEPVPQYFARALDHAQRLGKDVQYVSWADEGDTPALREIAEELR